ncbi:MAG: RNA methyltransferase [Desulfovibrionaceae bacterium]|nr:RNA methyltransferase [Desulfovibrionaceae bacterium]
MEEQPILAGLKPVLEFLEQSPEQADAVYVRKGQRTADTDRILDLCRRNGIRFTLCESAFLDRLCPHTSHQGAAVRLFQAGFIELEQLTELLYTAPLQLIAVLDHVQDPGNIGTLVRTLYAFGAAGIVVPRHNSAFLGSGARRSAAGALEKLPVCKVANISSALEFFRKNGLPVYGSACSVNGLNALTDPLHLPAVLVLGNEDKGLGPTVLKHCDHQIFIPMLRSFDSINVAQAGGILASCFLRHQL